VYYSLIIKTKNGGFFTLKDQNTLDEIKKLLQKYLAKDEFFVEKKNLSFDDVDEFIVLESKKSFEEIVDTEEQKYDTMFAIGLRSEDLVTQSDLVKNITDDLVNKISIPKKESFKNSIFIIHGRDNEMKLEVARFVESLGIKAIVLHEQPNVGKTIIEQIESYTNVSFAIALYSPDDEGRFKKECITITSSGPAKLRAFLCKSLSLHFCTKRRSTLRPADAGR